MSGVLERFRWLAILLAVLWLIEVANLITGYALSDGLGLRPRSFSGLWGILFMPLLHGSVSHAVANTAPLVVLGALLAVTAQQLVFKASIGIVVLGGVGVWLFGATAIHVGASGLIFGWFGFLVTRGVMERQPVPLLVAIGVVLFYGTMIWGVLPGQPGVSWEAHFFGCGAGVFVAYVLSNRSQI